MTRNPVLLSGTEVQATFDEKASCQRMKNERSSVSNRNRKLELQFPSVSAYLQACMTPKFQSATIFFIVTHWSSFTA